MYVDGVACSKGVEEEPPEARPSKGPRCASEKKAALKGDSLVKKDALTEQGIVSILDRGVQPEFCGGAQKRAKKGRLGESQKNSITGGHKDRDCGNALHWHL